jgi:predicted MFS family arabinose efflux permease
MQIQSDGGFDATSSAMPTLEDQLNSVGLGTLQWRVVFAAGVMVLGDGMELAAISMLERPLAREWGVSSDDLALIGSILFGGTIFGSIWGGWCSDTMGRKWTLSSFGLLFVFGGICSVASQSFMLFAVARFVSALK